MDLNNLLTNPERLQRENEMKLNIDLLMLACRKLRKDAETVRALGSRQTAATIEACVSEFEIAIDEWLDERLSPTRAGLEGPLAAATTAKHIREGRLPQAGRRGGPLVRRRDLFGVSQSMDLNSAIDRIVGGNVSADDPDDPFPGDE